jgi:small subunit ribosomal protein S17
MKQLVGRVITSSTPQAATVEIVRRWAHPVYHKTITRRKKYLTHCLIKVVPGDKVIIQECRPISKRKRWQLIKKI